MPQTKVRLINIPGNSAGKLRQSLYAAGTARIKDALEK
jgi:hypothetical protein